MNMNKKFKAFCWLLLVVLIGFTVALPLLPGPSKAGVAPMGKAEVTTTSQPAPEQLGSHEDLLKAVKEQPASIKRLLFTADGLRVTVEYAAGGSSVFACPDVQAARVVLALAQQAGIQCEVAPAPSSGPSFGDIFPWLIGAGFIGFFIFLYIKNKREQETRDQLARVSPTRPIIRNTPEGEKPSGNKKQQGDPGIIKVTFKDVAGCDEAVREMQRVVKGIIDRKIYDDFGAKLPRGILLFGPPGTGKTLLAKAVAGECDGSMEIASGSDFVEMYVGVGASRVRGLFERGRAEVKKHGKPHVIFIDEIDAVGGKRSGGNSNGGHQEREQTLNALLVEMDGMKSNAGIIVIAATNRIDMLDEALLRPGRFDAQIQIDLPDKAGREKIFAIHTRKKPLAKGVTFEQLANRSFGYSGAEIEGACNRAAIVAAERYAEQARALAKAGKKPEEIEKELVRAIVIEDFDEGIDFVRHGIAKASRQSAMSHDEKSNTAYHEAGHACVAAVLEGADPIVKITIMNRSRALGYVQYMPNQDRYSFNVKQAVARIITAMAGRASQEVYLQTVDTGASNDFEQATGLARRMVTQWGMSRLGRIHVGQNSEVGPILANNVDCEVRRIVDECYNVARYIVEKDKNRIEKVVGILLEKETILGPEWEQLTKDVASECEPGKVVFDPAAAKSEQDERFPRGCHEREQRC